MDRLRALQREGAENLLDRLIREYLSSTPELIAKMRENAARGNATAVRDAAHTLKSSSGFLGAIKVASLCQSLETQATEQALEQAVETLAALEPAFENAKAALEAEVGLGLVN